MIQLIDNSYQWVSDRVITMAQDKDSSSQAVQSTKVAQQKDNNEKRLGTLKLWQKHIEALARPSRSTQPLIKHYDDTIESDSSPIASERSH